MSNNVLRSVHRPELDRLLQMLERGEELSDAQLMWAKQWLWEIVQAPQSDNVSTGEKGLAADLYASISVRYKDKAKEVSAR